MVSLKVLFIIKRQIEHNEPFSTYVKLLFCKIERYSQSTITMHPAILKWNAVVIWKMRWIAFKPLIGYTIINKLGRLREQNLKN